LSEGQFSSLNYLLNTAKGLCKNMTQEMKIAIILAMYNMEHFNNSYDNIILDCSRSKKA
jgi:hypothetical protein